jgi:hypothetical protein
MQCQNLSLFQTQNQGIDSTRTAGIFTRIASMESGQIVLIDLDGKRGETR